MIGTAQYFRYPDVQRVLVDDLEALVGPDRTGIETPADLAGQLPFIRIQRVGGRSDRINDRAVVDIDAFAGDYTTAEELAEQIRQRLVGPPPASLLDRCGCEEAPRELPWGDGTIRRFGATYVVVSRRRAI